jgi:hypothetical protein
MNVLSGISHPMWLGALKIGIRAHGFNIKPGWATNVEFGVKFPRGIDVQSVGRELKEHLGYVQKLKRYNIWINHENHGIGAIKFKFGSLDLFGTRQIPHNHWIQSFDSLGVMRYSTMKSSKFP